jgi:hypothetical protein
VQQHDAARSRAHHHPIFDVGWPDVFLHRIVRVDTPEDDAIPQCRGDAPHAGVTGAERGPEEGAGGSTARVPHPRLGALQLAGDPCVGEAREVDVRVGMVAQCVPVRNDAPQQKGMRGRPSPGHEERRPHPRRAQRRQDRRHRRRIPAQIKRERDRRIASEVSSRRRKKPQRHKGHKEGQVRSLLTG